MTLISRKSVIKICNYQGDEKLPPTLSFRLIATGVSVLFWPLPGFPRIFLAFHSPVKMLAAGVKVARIYKIHIDAANVIYQRVTARERKRVGPEKGVGESGQCSEWG